MKKKEIEMEKLVNNTELYALWLPITAFDELCMGLHKKEYLKDTTPSSNQNWSWINFNHEELKFTIDSLGFIFMDGVRDEAHLDLILKFLVKQLNVKTKENILDTFLNKHLTMLVDKDKEDEYFFQFLKDVTLSFPSIKKNLKFEHIDFNLALNNKSIAHEEKLKFSLIDTQENEAQQFYTILNRNFENSLKKSLFFTHGLTLEEGELYELSVVEDVCQNIQNFIPDLEIEINSEVKSKDDKFIKMVMHKIIQDTIEERVVLNFLHKTKVNYLSKIINEVAANNEILKKLNSYLLEDIKRDTQENSRRQKDLDDESATEIFVQNLLQVTPKFYMIDSKIQEAYYIKVGNMTTNLSVKNDETIKSTLYYSKWKASINFCIETANKAKESLDIYHQNKTLKELEDISYNANYQADIEDIRELKKNKAFALDESSKRILFFIAIVTLAGEAPLVDFNSSWDLSKDFLESFKSAGFNALQIFINFTIYYYIFVKLLMKRIVGSEEKKNKKSFFQVLKTKLKRMCRQESLPLLHKFEESDYDKHEHRSNRALYKYSEDKEVYKKIPISYNNLISSYTLVDKLKQVQLIHKSEEKVYRFEMFPSLLRDVPIGNERKHVYRENYRISGNDRVATKIMYRYKLNELTLKDFLAYAQEDTFMKEYERYLSHQKIQKHQDGFTISKAIEFLRPHESLEDEVELTLYIVYSFVLKFDYTDEEDTDLYFYNISKDQFRVHYHINKLDYTSKEDFEKKQEYLAKIIDIYFLKRLKRFKEVEEWKKD